MNTFKPALKLAICLILPLFILSSCKDDDDPVIDKANLTGDKWVYDHADAGDQFASALVDAFLEGSEYTFNTDNTYVSILLSLENTGTWEYGEATITLNPGDDLQEVWEVTELSANTLVYISTTIDDNTEEETKVTFVYKR